MRTLRSPNRKRIVTLLVAVEQRREALKIRGRWRDRTGRAGSKPASLAGGASAAACSATSPGITTTATPRLPTASRMAISSVRGICCGSETSSQ